MCKYLHLGKVVYITINQPSYIKALAEAGGTGKEGRKARQLFARKYIKKEKKKKNQGLLFRFVSAE